jgi:hypothetical protein
MTTVNILLSLLLTVLAYFSFFILLLTAVVPVGFDSGKPTPLKERLMNGGITGGISLLCLFLVYNLSGATIAGIACLPPILFTIYLNTPTKY